MSKAEWDSTKEKNLWEYLSRSLSGGDVDWEGLAYRFNVTVPFILQQAAWLYEKELEQVRAQMQKVKVVTASTKHTNVRTDGGKKHRTSALGLNPNLDSYGGSSSGSSSFFNDPERKKKLLTVSRNSIVPPEEEEPEPAFLPSNTSATNNNNNNNNVGQYSSNDDNSSTFTELSETSISKSALEEALLHELGNESSLPQ